MLKRVACGGGVRLRLRLRRDKPGILSGNAFPKAASLERSVTACCPRAAEVPFLTLLGPPASEVGRIIQANNVKGGTSREGRVETRPRDNRPYPFAFSSDLFPVIDSISILHTRVVAVALAGISHSRPE